MLWGWLQNLWVAVLGSLHSLMNPCQAETATLLSCIFLILQKITRLTTVKGIWLASISQNNIHYFFTTNSNLFISICFSHVMGLQMWRTLGPVHFKNVGLFLVKHSLQQSLLIFHHLKQMIPTGTRVITSKPFWHTQHQMEFQTRTILRVTPKVIRRFKVLYGRSVCS